MAFGVADGAWIALLSAPRMPSNMRSNVASWPTGSLSMAMATSRNTPSIERSPTELALPSNPLCSEMPRMDDWKSGNW